MTSSSLVRKYFLIPEDSLSIKRDKVFLGKIDQADGWEKEAFQILTRESDKGGPDKKNLLLTLIKSQNDEGRDHSQQYDGLLNILPKNARHKARGLLYYILKIADIDEDGLLVYRKGGMEGQTGSSLIDALRYLVLPHVSVVPHDILSLAEMLYQYKAPLSLFGGPRKQPGYILSQLVSPSPKTVPEVRQSWESVF